VALGLLNNWIFDQDLPPPRCIAVHNYARAGGAASRAKVLWLGHLERLGLPKGGVKKMLGVHRERGSGGERFFVAARRCRKPRTRRPSPWPSPKGRGDAKNVQIASGCIKNWYELRVGVSRCYCEVILRQRIAAMPLPVVDETRTSKSCIKNGPFGGATAIRNGRRFPRPGGVGAGSGQARSLPHGVGPRQADAVGVVRRPRNPHPSPLPKGEGTGKEGRPSPWPSPKGRGMSEVNLKWSRATDLRQLESTKQMYT
jgi:hypothetical protein